MTIKKLLNDQFEETFNVEKTNIFTIKELNQELSIYENRIIEINKKIVELKNKINSAKELI